jgi:hypothetical protein
MTRRLAPAVSRRAPRSRNGFGSHAARSKVEKTTGSLLSKARVKPAAAPLAANGCRSGNQAPMGPKRATFSLLFIVINWLTL